jgi:hypothetical protein
MTRQWDEDLPRVHCQRTMVLDEVRDLVHSRRLRLPGGIDSNGMAKHPAVRETVNHFASLTRGAVERDNGRSVVAYGHTGPDHYAHTMQYLLTATYGPLRNRGEIITLRDILPGFAPVEFEA